MSKVMSKVDIWDSSSPTFFFRNGDTTVYRPYGRYGVERIIIDDLQTTTTATTNLTEL
jgi:hypothetical protein